jgi:hypothetical protein
MAVRDHITRVSKLRAKIQTVHPAERIIEVVTVDGGARRLLSAMFHPPLLGPSKAKSGRFTRKMVTGD